MKGAAWLLLIAAPAMVTGAGPSRASTGLSFEVVTDLRLPGGVTRMDYISVDPASARAYLAHMGDGAVIVVATAPPRVIGVIRGTPRVRGVLAVPSLDRVYASAAGSSEVVAISAATLEVKARIADGDADGLDYAPSVKRLFVTDQRGGDSVVIDVDTNRVVTRIPVGRDAGNTRVDAATGHVFVAVGRSNELVEIDAKSLAILGRWPLPGIEGAHGVTIDPVTRTAFVAGEDNATVCAFSLDTHTVTAVSRVGTGVDVLDVDPGTRRLFVASESGVVSIFDVSRGRLRKLEQGFFAPHAHVVGVDRATHMLYFPLEDVAGHPTLRAVRYTGP